MSTRLLSVVKKQFQHRRSILARALLPAYITGHYDIYPPDLGPRIDLHALDKARNSQPIFTRDLVQNIARLRDEASEVRRKHAIWSPDLRGTKRIIWTPPPKRPEPNDRYIERVQVQWLEYAELSSEYSLIPTFNSTSTDSEWSEDTAENRWYGFLPPSETSLLHWYNRHDKQSLEEHIPMPALLRTSFYDNLALDAPRVQSVVAILRQMMQASKKGWEERATRELLKSTISKFADGFTGIRKIVCLGFGALNQSPRQAPAHQHIAAMTIASTIDALNASLHPKSPRPPVEIIAQDPMYAAPDRLLYSELGRKITFVDDPDGLLAVDKHTLVIAPFVPCYFPFMQVLTDMFWDAPLDERPAGFMFDNADPYGKLEQKTHSASGEDRLTPRAAKFLLPPNYTHLDFQTGHNAEMFLFTESELKWMDQSEVLMWEGGRLLDEGGNLTPELNLDFWFYKMHIFLRGQVSAQGDEGERVWSPVWRSTPDGWERHER